MTLWWFVFLVFVLAYRTATIFCRGRPETDLVKAYGDFFFDRLALYSDVNRHFFAPSVFLFYFFTAIRSLALRDRGL